MPCLKQFKAALNPTLAIASNHCIKDLGILFQDNLKFSEHINKIVSSANSRLGIIRNTFHELSEHNFIVLYKSFVRPILEYCCTTWSPHLIMYHKEIEKSKEEQLN